MMTATPITTSILVRSCDLPMAQADNFPQDIWNLGRVLGIFTSADNGEFDEMKRELNRARAYDRKQRDEEGNPKSGVIVRGVLEGRSGYAGMDIDMQQQVVTAKWMKVIRARFRGQVMRRTGASKDNTGSLISGVAEPSEHLLLLELYDWERENLAELADKMVDSPQAGARLGSSEVSKARHGSTLLGGV